MFTHLIKCPVIDVVDQPLIIGVDLVWRISTTGNFPIETVVSPDDRFQSEAIGNGANTIVYISERRLQETNKSRVWKCKRRREDVHASK